MTAYISNCLEGLLGLINRILSKNRQNQKFMLKLQESLEILRDLISHLKKANLLNLEQTLIRNLEKSIDKAMRYIFKRLKVSLLKRIFKLDTEKFKLKMLMNDIINNLNQVKLIHLKNYIELFESSIKKLDQVLKKEDKLLNKLDPLIIINNELYNSLEEGAKQSKKISKFFYFLNDSLPELESKGNPHKYLIYASIESYFKVFQFFRSKDTEIISLGKEAKISVIELKDFVETFINNPENKQRLLDKRILHISETGDFLNQLYFLCLDDDTLSEFHKKGSFYRIDRDLDRYNLLNRYVSRQNSIARLERVEETYSIIPLIKSKPIYIMNYSQTLLSVDSYFVVLDHRKDINVPVEYYFEVTKIEGGDDDSDLTDRNSKFYMKVHLMVIVSDETQEEIIFPNSTKYDFLNEVIVFENEEYFLQPRNKYFSIFYNLRPLKSQILNSSTILRIGDANYQIVYK